MENYGHVRVSSTDQNEDRRLDALRGKGVDGKNIYIDKQSGKDFDCSDKRGGSIFLHFALRLVGLPSEKAITIQTSAPSKLIASAAQPDISKSRK